MDSDAFAALFVLAFYGVYFAIIGIIMIVSVISNWFLFKKAGYDGWKALIPYYNSWILSELSLGNGVYMLITFVPVIGLVFSYYWLYKICVSFGKDIGFTIGYMFLHPVFALILAFDKSQYIGPTKNFWEN